MISINKARNGYIIYGPRDKLYVAYKPEDVVTYVINLLMEDLEEQKAEDTLNYDMGKADPLAKTNTYTKATQSISNAAAMDIRDQLMARQGKVDSSPRYT